MSNKMTPKVKALWLSIFILVSQPVLVAGGEMITLQKENSGQEISLRVGNLLRIELSGIGGTGYSWHIINLDPQYLKLISAETGKIPETGRIGGPVRHIWIFQTQKAGQTEIKMNYYRPWEGVEKSADHFLIKIKIIQNGS
jgi:predicted secreted protein